MKKKVIIERFREHEEGEYYFTIDDPKKPATLRILNSISSIESFPEKEQEMDGEFVETNLYDNDRDLFLVVSGKAINESRTKWEIEIEWKGYKLIDAG